MTCFESPLRDQNDWQRARGFVSESRGTGCSRSGVFWTRSQEGGGAKIRSEQSHDGVASVAEGICRFPARDVPFTSMILGIFTVNRMRLGGRVKEG